MAMKSRISPDEPFPADLRRLRDQEVEVLNSKVHREIAHEVAEDGEVAAETEFRKAELAEELDDREAGPRLTLVPEQGGLDDPDLSADGVHASERRGEDQHATRSNGASGVQPGGLHRQSVSDAERS